MAPPTNGELAVKLDHMGRDIEDHETRLRVVESEAAERRGQLRAFATIAGLVAGLVSTAGAAAVTLLLG